MKPAILILTAMMSLPLTASASEIDSYTNRFAPLDDSLTFVNRLTYQLLNNSLTEANEKGSCDEKALYKSLRKNFNNQYQGELPKLIIKSDDVSKVSTPSNVSIYRDFKWYEAIVQGGTSHIKDPIADLMKVNGVLIGTDKFEHFLGSGYHYFKKYYEDGEPLSEALRIGWKAENGLLGAVTTGVMSYADMTANFNGMRFWNHMLQKQDDVLGAQYNFGPYVTCENNQWVATNKHIDWSNYIDAAFDEGINCSRYKNETLASKVAARMQELEDNDPAHHYTCPMDPGALEKLTSKYGNLTPYLINPYGNNPRGVEEFDTLYPEP